MSEKEGTPPTADELKANAELEAVTRQSVVFLLEVTLTTLKKVGETGRIDAETDVSDAFLRYHNDPTEGRFAELQQATNTLATWHGWPRALEDARKSINDAANGQFTIETLADFSGRVMS